MSDEIGTSEQHVRQVSPERCAEIDAALGLQAISIRLPKELIDSYKQVAEERGVLYQPLMREALLVWIRASLPTSSEALSATPDLKESDK